MSEDYEGSVQFVGVASRDDEAAMQDFVDRHELSGFPHISDEAGEVWERFGVVGQPAWVFATASGDYEVVFGAIPEDELREKLDALAGT